MAKRLRKLRIEEVSLVDKGANQHAEIAFFKRDEGHAMDKDEVLRLMERRQAELNDPWPATDERWLALYHLYKQAPPAEAAPVEKATRPSDVAMAAIEKAAQALVEESGGTMTIYEATEQALVADPELYRRYRERYLAE